MSESQPERIRTFRLPTLTYVTVLFLLFCTLPLAFAKDGQEGAPVAIGPRITLLLIPLAAAVFIARTVTIVGPTGIAVRAALGTRLLSWDEVRGLSVSGRSVYAVLADGSIRLPCVRTSDLAEVSRGSGKRLPEIADPVRKFAPSRRRR